MTETEIQLSKITRIIQRKVLEEGCDFWMLDSKKVIGLDTDALLPLLGHQSQERYAKIYRKERREQFLLGRILLKHALSDTLGIEADRISFHENSSTSPTLLVDGKGTQNIHFNLSHSRHFIACATSTQKPVGLDIEWRDDTRDIDGSVALALLENERQWLKNQPPEQKNNGFYTLWTRKEACYKCLSSQDSTPENKGFYRIDSLDSRLGKWESWMQAHLAISVFKPS